MTLSVAQLRTFVDSELGDDALQALLDAAAEAIAEVAGSTDAVTEYLAGGYARIVTVRQVASVTSITEDGILLGTDDYRAAGYVLTRLATGTHPASRWGRESVAVYAPADEAAERDRVQLALVKLDLTHNPGLASERVGDWQEDYTSNSAFNYETERASILASLGTSGGGMVVPE